MGKKKLQAEAQLASSWGFGEPPDVVLAKDGLEGCESVTHHSKRGFTGWVNKLSSSEDNSVTVPLYPNWAQKVEHQVHFWC